MLILIRGIPGSGKTTLAKTKYPNFVRVEADMYFIRNGKYEFNPEEIKDAHEWCQKTTKKLIELGLDVVVSNTFTRKWEMEFYLNLPTEVKVITATSRYKNIHGVPERIVEAMKERFEPYP